MPVLEAGGLLYVLDMIDDGLHLMFLVMISSGLLFVWVWCGARTE